MAPNRKKALQKLSHERRQHVLEAANSSVGLGYKFRSWRRGVKRWMLECIQELDHGRLLKAVKQISLEASSLSTVRGQSHNKSRLSWGGYLIIRCTHSCARAPTHTEYCTHSLGLPCSALWHGCLSHYFIPVPAAAAICKTLCDMVPPTRCHPLLLPKVECSFLILALDLD